MEEGGDAKRVEMQEGGKTEGGGREEVCDGMGVSKREPTSGASGGKKSIGAMFQGRRRAI